VGVSMVVATALYAQNRVTRTSDHGVFLERHVTESFTLAPPQIPSCMSIPRFRMDEVILLHNPDLGPGDRRAAGGYSLHSSFSRLAYLVAQILT
jgi:hypothetical protein